MSANVIPEQNPTILPPQTPAKRLIRKYDKRAKSPHSIRATEAAKNSPKHNGLKPLWAKHLTRNAAAYALKEAGIKETALRFLSATKFVSGGKGQPDIEVPDVAMQWQAFTYLWDRLEGKPFTAINPAATEMPHTLVQDNRLQVAIQQMLPAKGKKPASLQAQTSPELTQAASLAAIPVRTPTIQAAEKAR